MPPTFFESKFVTERQSWAIINQNPLTPSIKSANTSISQTDAHIQKWPVKLTIVALSDIDATVYRPEEEIAAVAEGEFKVFNPISDARKGANVGDYDRACSNCRY